MRSLVLVVPAIVPTVGGVQPKDEILRYFHQIDHGLHRYLREKKSPLILAGVEYLFPIYREANSYPHLLDEGVTGNSERLSPQELHAQAWKIIEARLRRSFEQAIERYYSLAGTGLTTSTLHEIIPEAYRGRVDTLFVPVGVQQWGTFDEETGEISLHETNEPGYEDMLGLAAIYTYSNGGKVFAVPPDELPVEASLASIYRY
jgi:hypothetical protein